MRILLTGLGSIGRRHARLLREHDCSFEIIAYRHDPSDIGNSMNIEVYTDLTEALETSPDVAFVTNPTHLHVNTALQCARYNCHLFIEKPISNTLDGVNELIEEVTKRDLVTQIGCQLRFDPVLNHVKDLIEGNELGEPLSFQVYSGSYLPDWRPNQDYRESYSADPQQGGGVVLDLIHEIDYVRWLFGPTSTVKSEISHVVSLNIDSEAIAEILVRVRSGVVGNVHLSYCRIQPRRTVEVVCEEGVVTGDLKNKEVITETKSAREVQTYEYGRDTRFRNQLDYFIEHVQTNSQCENDLKEGKEVLKTALNVREGNSNE